MKEILVLHTGGTISMQADEAGKVSPNQNNPMTQVGLSLEHIHLTVVDFLNLPSPHITPHHMLKMYHYIQQRVSQFDAVVITHGTDTLEETAYFLDTMVLPIELPIVITGAMRSANEIGSDGIYNYLTALRVASHEKAKGKGVLVVMNDEIHAAKYVTKTHTTNVSTFQTPTHGPLGIVMKDDLLFFKTAEPRVRFELRHISGTVPIIKAYAGMGDGSILSLLTPDRIQGLVIEALGAGNVPPLAVSELEKLIASGIPVVLVSRCFNGIAEPVYAYRGGGASLKRAGVMFVKELNAPKARLKLLIALNAGLTGQELKNYIEG
ncbi:TPA: asparaginase [Streptococcus equi subsp. zooepidemicus]|nr:asparaginase [Streptococcus equi subsp. zooepidemicus]HEL0688335.1 asparaginase [Streptococcus equi subsp. zooepidemicus]HEL0774132.1 asparaginase [Streptococcus equi subsp. zooepidemicus]HEL1042036.1 asparaginase [Streptococcus equi subsp. zooepidemicus]HEL1081152.1 asparaginase [Streptococcus equi subsp. zooepidemicus]